MPAEKIPAARAGEMTQQLFNLRDDPKEHKNLIGDHREVAARLADLLNTLRAKQKTR
jgi:hypothetical protein